MMGFRFSLVFILSIWILCVAARSGLYDPPGGRIHATTLYHSVDQQAFDSLLLRAQESVGNMMMETYTASGIPLLCEMPLISFGEAEEDGFGAQHSSATVASYLLPLKSQCMRHIDGWWTYEFCFGKQLRQYHLSQEGKLDEYFLGRAVDPNLGVELLHEMETNDVELLRRMDALKVDRGGDHAFFYSESYAFGTPCEIEDRAQRQVEIRWFCSNGASSSSIRGIKEPASCQYILEVDTPLLCQHPSYRSAETPLHVIACYFVDNEPSMPSLYTTTATTTTTTQGAQSSAAHDPTAETAGSNTPAHDATHSSVPSHSQQHDQQNHQQPHQKQQHTHRTNSIDADPHIRVQEGEDSPLKITFMSPGNVPQASKGGDEGQKSAQPGRYGEDDEDALGMQMNAVLRSSIKQRATGKVQLARSRAESEITEDSDEEYEALTGDALEAFLSSLSDNELLVLLGTIDDALNYQLTDEDGVPLEDQEDLPIIIEIDTIHHSDNWIDQDKDDKQTQKGSSSSDNANRHP